MSESKTFIEILKEHRSKTVYEALHPRIIFGDGSGMSFSKRLHSHTFYDGDGSQPVLKSLGKGKVHQIGTENIDEFKDGDLTIRIKSK